MLKDPVVEFPKDLASGFFFVSQIIRGSHSITALVGRRLLDVCLYLVYNIVIKKLMGHLPEL